MAKRIVFTATGEVREPRKGDWFFENGMCHCAGYDWKREPRPILTRTEETIPDPPKPRQVVWVQVGTAPEGVTGFGGTMERIESHTFDGRTYRRVEVPTKAEAFDASVNHDEQFMYGVLWLADKLGIKIE